MTGFSGLFRPAPRTFGRVDCKFPRRQRKSGTTKMIDLGTILDYLAFAFLISGFAAPAVVRIFGSLVRQPDHRAPAASFVERGMARRPARPLQAPAPAR